MDAPDSLSQPFPDCLSSKRLQLRRLHAGDAEALCAYRSMPEIARYQYWENFGLNDAIRLIDTDSAAQPNIPGTWFQLAIVNTSTGYLIGDCGLHTSKEDPQQMEIGITIAPRQQGHGYADEAVECVLNYIFGTLDKHRVFASVDVLNRSAVGLCRRLGFRQEAHFIENIWFKGRWASEYLFAMLKREWQERKSL